MPRLLDTRYSANQLSNKYTFNIVSTLHFYNIHFYLLGVTSLTMFLLDTGVKSLLKGKDFNSFWHVGM